MNHLELFSGTHSFGKVSSKLNYNVVSLDRDLGAKCPFTDYLSKEHIKEDILTWNYKKYPVGHFKLITASPVCLWWSHLRKSWIGRKIKAHGDTIITTEILEEDINKYGKPMVDKMFEIIEYFKPECWIVENPATGRMRHYIASKYPKYNTFNDYSYCMFSDWGYRKTTRFWSNIKDLENISCNNKCGNMDNKKHKKSVDGGGKRGGNNGKGSKKLERYRIPKDLIEYLINRC